MPPSLRDRIKPLANLSRVDEVELALLKLLASNDLKPGDPLPKEVELAEAFGVSRTVVREALTRLRAIGLVESVKRKGSVITHPDVLTPLERMLHPQILDEETLRDIFEIRLVLEVGMADFLFARMTPAQLEELEDIVAEEKEDSSAVFDQEFEIRFHGKLYEISGNRTLQRFQSLLLPVFGYVHRSGMLEQPGPADAPFVTHHELVEILRSGSPEHFREGMRVHLENHFRRVL